MIRGREAATAWAVLGAGVVVYELFAPPGQLMSEGVDRALDRHPHITRLGVFLVALHLTNNLPPVIDPLTRLGDVFRGLRRPSTENGPSLASAAAIGIAVETLTHA